MELAAAYSTGADSDEATASGTGGRHARRRTPQQRPRRWTTGKLRRGSPVSPMPLSTIGARSCESGHEKK